jgi:hypothetical protein
MSERPAFIDPTPVVTGGEVDESRVPRWFLLVAALVAVAAFTVLVRNLSGPALSYGRDFQSGRDAIPSVAPDEELVEAEPTSTGSPAATPEATPTSG